MAARLTCGYCSRWRSSSATAVRNNDGETQGKKKKKKLKRTCEVTGREVTASGTACKYLTPIKYFWCNEYDYWLDVLQCLNRQRAKNAKSYENCSTGCRQYWKELNPIVEQFNIKLPQRRFIKRRVRVRTIKRRKKRIIERRARTRVIKRRA